MSFIAGYLLGRAGAKDKAPPVILDILEAIEALPIVYSGGLANDYHWEIAMDAQSKIFKDTAVEASTGNVYTFGTFFLRVYKQDKMIYVTSGGSYSTDYIWIITSQKVFSFSYQDEETGKAIEYPEGYLRFSATFNYLANRTASVRAYDDVYVDFSGEYYLHTKEFKPDGSVSSEGERVMSLDTIHFPVVQNTGGGYTGHILTALSQAELEKELFNIQKAMVT